MTGGNPCKEGGVEKARASGGVGRGVIVGKDKRYIFFAGYRRLNIVGTRVRKTIFHGTR